MLLTEVEELPWHRLTARQATVHMNDPAPHPVVFISYSHDTPEHKKWVGELGTRLMNNGVDVILDQWDLGLGDDAARFMTNGVTKANRVLMICTESYVVKANEGRGGVGYEAMIVTGELVSNLGTDKFIPIVKQQDRPRSIPAFLGARLYLDLGDPETYETQFIDLLREIHNAPANPKPPLGRNPFQNQQVSTPAPNPIEVSSSFVSSENRPEPLKAYEDGLNLARRGDMLGWRKSVQQLRRGLSESALDWRCRYQSLSSYSEEAVLDFLRPFEPLMAMAIAGVESGDHKFNKQIGIIDDLVHLSGWNRGGLTGIVEQPFVSAFVYQAIHGAVSLQTGQLDLAVALARTELELYPGDPSKMLMEWSRVTGWLESFAGNCQISGTFLRQLPKHWSWINIVFGSEDDYLAAVGAYYMLLNYLEFIDAVNRDASVFVQSNSMSFDSPLYFQGETDIIQRRAYRLLLNQSEALLHIMNTSKLDNSELEKLWMIWVSWCDRWSSSVFRTYRARIAHAGLIKDISAKGHLL